MVQRSDVKEKGNHEHDEASNGSPTCPHLARKDRQLFCELFESYLPARGMPTKSAKSSEQPQQSMGLCTSCALRLTCTYPRSKQGVWQCEEYE
jgi:hypothetical protein